MLGSHPRRDGGHSAAVVTTIATVPAVALLFSRGDSVAQLVPAVGLTSYALVLGSAVVTYFHWRLASDRRPGTMEVRLAGWLTVGLTVGAVDGLLHMTSGATNDNLRPTVTQLVLTLALCVVALVSERVDVPADPAVFCTAAAVAIAAVYSLAALVTPRVELSGASATLATSGLTILGFVLALIVLTLHEVSLWARRRVAVAAVLLTAAQSVITHENGRAALEVFGIAAFVVGSLTVCLMTYDLLRASMREREAELDRLHLALDDLRGALLEDRELLHEVGATLAGIRTASEVIRGGGSVPAPRRRRLEEMLGAEVARLGRLMSSRIDDARAAEDRLIRIDDVVRPVVVSHQERQQNVVWAPNGQQAYGDPDELAEVCNILLENAATHARAALVRLSVSAHDGEILVVCSDEGPGVPAEVSNRLFDAEARGDDSPGQGLGLAIAHRLACTRGGSIELVDAGQVGAAFAVRLPPKERGDVSAGHVA